MEKAVTSKGENLRCLKCNGKLYYFNDPISGDYLGCLQCGFRRYAPEESEVAEKGKKVTAKK